MSKKNKKKPQQNLPLKERLEKHWNNANWAGFVSLYMRDRPLSDASPWHPHWGDALYNCMTQALFADRDPENAKTLADVILSEPSEKDSETGFSSPGFSLRACARLVKMLYDSNECDVTFDVADSSLLPGVYAKLYRGQEKLSLDKKHNSKPSQNSSEALVLKFAKQFEALPRAKSLLSYTNFLKTAQLLEDKTSGLPSSSTFRAIRLVAELIRQLNTAERTSGGLRSVDKFLPRLFTEVPANQRHPAVFGLWDFFCRSGGRKYGKDWELAARVAAFSFADEAFFDGLENVENILRTYRHLAKLPSRATGIDIVPKLKEYGIKWTDQEKYLLDCFYVASFVRRKEESESFPLGVRELAEAFKSLSEIGRKWRPEIPWTRDIQSYFDCLIFEHPEKFLPLFAKTDIAWEGLSNMALVLFLFKETSKLKEIERSVAKRLPLRFSEEDLEKIAYCLMRLIPPLDKLAGFKKFCDPVSYQAMLGCWIEGIVQESLESAEDGCELPDLLWAEMPSGFLPFCASELPVQSDVGAFCRLCVEKERYRLSDDPAKIEAFFSAIPPPDAPEERLFFVGVLSLFLLTWPGVSSAFHLRLFDAALPFHQMSQEWGEIAELVEKMPDPDRKAVASGIAKRLREIQAKEKSWETKQAICLFDAVKKGKPHSKRGEEAFNFTGAMEKFFNAFAGETNSNDFSFRSKKKP